MAITLNLKHTFTTRVVYSTEEVQEIRNTLSAAAIELRAVILELTGKEKADALVAIQTCERATAGDDEFMIVSLTKTAFRKLFTSSIRKRLEHLNVTRMSPLKTEVVS